MTGNRRNVTTDDRMQGSLWPQLANRHSDLPLVPIHGLVDQIKNVGCGAEPLRTLFKGPEAVGFWQPTYETLNKRISVTSLVFMVTRLVAEKFGCQTFSRVHSSHHEITPLVEGNIRSVRLFEIAHIGRSFMRLTPYACSPGLFSFGLFDRRVRHWWRR
jgi:hypothetical protein